MTEPISAMTPQRLAEIRQKNAASVAYLRTELDAEALADTAYGYGAELLAEVDRLTQSNLALTQTIHAYPDAEANAAANIAHARAQRDRALAERDQARAMVRHAYQRWPAPVFWGIAAKLAPDAALPDWVTGNGDD